MKKNVKVLTATYVVIALVFSTTLVHISTVPFFGNEKEYFLCGIGLLSGVGLFYAFSLLMLAVAEACGDSERAIEQSRDQWRTYK